MPSWGVRFTWFDCKSAVFTNPSRKVELFGENNLKTRALRFSVDGNILKTGLFENMRLR